MLKSLTNKMRGHPICLPLLLIIFFAIFSSYAITNTYSYFSRESKIVAVLKAADVFFLNIKPGHNQDDSDNEEENDDTQKDELVLNLGIVKPDSSINLDNLLVFENITQVPLKISWCFDDDIAGFFNMPYGEIILLPYKNKSKVPQISISEQAYNLNNNNYLLEQVEKSLFLSDKESYLSKEIRVGNAEKKLSKFANPLTFNIQLNVAHNTKPGFYGGNLTIKVNDKYLVKKIPIRFTVEEAEQTIKTSVYSSIEPNLEKEFSQYPVKKTTRNERRVQSAIEKPQVNSNLTDEPVLLDEEKKLEVYEVFINEDSEAENSAPNEIRDAFIPENEIDLSNTKEQNANETVLPSGLN